MNLDDYRRLFIVVTLCLALIAASPALVMLVPSEGDAKPFSELGLMGPNNTAENYPYNVSAGEMYNFYVDVANQMGDPEYYAVYVKFGNSSELELTNSEPSSLSTLYEFRCFVDDEASWESPVSFEVQDLTLMNEPGETPVLTVGEAVINGAVFPVDSSVNWNAEYAGFYFRLSFELWRYDSASNDFVFQDCIVGLRLRINSP